MLKSYLLHTIPTKKDAFNSYRPGKKIKARTEVNWEAVSGLNFSNRIS